MELVKGFHGEWNMGSPGGWEYQRMAQILGNLAWNWILDNVEVGVDIDFEHLQINAMPGFTRMVLKAHEIHHGRNPVHAVLLAEAETLDTVLENKKFVEQLNNMEGVKASLAGPGDMGLRKGKVTCRGEEATVIFMDFNMNVLLKIGEKEDIEPINEAIRQGILVNPKGMEPLGAKGLFEVLTDPKNDQISEGTRKHTPWTRQFFDRSTTDPEGNEIRDLAAWVKEHWKEIVLKPAHGYSGHGIYVGFKHDDPESAIRDALDKGDYIVQALVPLELWSERSVGIQPNSDVLQIDEWQTDFRCFITHEGLQGFLARFGGVPTNVGSGGGIQPLAVIRGDMEAGEAVDHINEALLKLGFKTFKQIQDEVEKEAVKMGFTYLLGPIKILLRPRLLTERHIFELKQYAADLWQDATRLELLWRKGKLDSIVRISDEEKALAMSRPWSGSPALMVSDGLFSFGADLY